MRFRSKIFSLLLLPVLLFSLLALYGCAGEDDTVYAILSEGHLSKDEGNGAFYYSLYENNTAVITGVKASGDVLSIPAAVDGVTVTTVGKRAFEGASFTYLVLPDTVKRIESSAFADCENLCYVSLGGGVRYLGDSAFSNCANLREVTGTGALKEIGANVFFFCSSLYRFDFPASLTSIGSSAFYYCTALSEVYLPDTEVSVGDSAFGECSSLVLVSLGKIPSIPESCFVKCISLAEVRIPKSVKSIGPQAFRGCSTLLTVSIEKGLKTVALDAFYGCDALKTYNFSAGSWAHGRIRFENGNEALTKLAVNYKTGAPSLPQSTVDTNFDYRTYLLASTEVKTSGDFSYMIFSDGSAVISAYKGSAKHLTVPASLDGNPVKVLSTGSFANNPNLESVTVEPGITVIEHYTFYGCQNLKEVSIPNTVHSIGYGAFTDSPYIANLSEEFAVVGDGVLLKYNGQDPHVVIPGNVKHIGPAFAESETLLSVRMGDSVLSVGPSAFFYCESLVFASLGKNVKVIDDSAFRYCADLRGIFLPRGITHIGPYAFSQCVGLRALHLPDTVTTLDYYSFEGARNIAYLFLPKGLPISDYAFDGCAFVHLFYGGTNNDFIALGLTGTNYAVNDATRHHEVKDPLY